LTWRLRDLSAWWRRPQVGTAAFTLVPRPDPSSVPEKYSAFYTYLERRYSSTVVLTFYDIEALLGFPLPSAARSDQTWWTGTSTGGDRHSQAWSAAHRTAKPNLAAQTVEFVRVA
jgi:hypothetical protein